MGEFDLAIGATPQVPVDRLPDRWAGLPVQVSKQGKSLADATLAVRYGFEAQEWNVDIMAVRGWRSSPSLRPVADATGLSLQGVVSRQNSVGFSADKPLGPMVLRLEGIYAQLAPVKAAVSTGSSPGRFASLGAGLDVRVGAWFLAGQVVVQHDREESPTSDNGAFVSAIVQRKWLQDRFSLRGVHIVQARSGSSWSSLQATYELSSNHVLRLQGDLFRGDATEAFGSLKQRSRICAALIYKL